MFTLLFDILYLKYYDVKLTITNTSYVDDKKNGKKRKKMLNVSITLSTSISITK